METVYNPHQPLPPRAAPFVEHEGSFSHEQNGKSGQEIAEAQNNHSVEVFTSDHPVIGHEVKRAAQALNTRVYLRKGFIDHEDIHDGLYEDEYSEDERATYYFAQNTEKDVVSRQIKPPENGDFTDLPTLQNFKCDSQKIAETAGVSSIDKLKNSEVVEISALSAERKDTSEEPDVSKAELTDSLEAVPFLYASMLRDSLEKGHKLWVANMERPLIDAISTMTGPGLLHEVGEEKQYIGPATTPVAINPQETVKSILDSEEPYMETYKNYIREVFDGLNADKVPKDLRKTLQDNEININRSNLAKRIIKNKHFLPQTALMGYSLARVVPASTVDQFEGSTEALYAIDVGTAPTYTYGVMQMYTGKNTKQKLTGLGIAVPSFLAPYAYYYAEGQDYPAEVNIIAGGLVAGAILNEIRQRRSSKKKEAEYKDAIDSD